jgi:hypothetical protein
MSLLHQFTDVVLQSDGGLRNVTKDMGFRITTPGGGVLGTIEPQGERTKHHLRDLIWKELKSLLVRNYSRPPTEYHVRDADGDLLAIFVAWTHSMPTWSSSGGATVLLANRRVVAYVNQAGALGYTVRNTAGELVSALRTEGAWSWFAESPSGERQADVDRTISLPLRRSVVDTGKFRPDQGYSVLTESRSFRIRFSEPVSVLVWYGVLAAVVRSAH